MTVLIIEPDRILAQQYRRAFKKAGVKVKLCTDAQTSITTIDKQPPDAVVLELQLAGHSGVEFLHEFRSYDDWSNIPVFILSGVPEYALNTDKNTWAKFGVERYFYKPRTTLAQLVGVVKGHVA